MSHEAEGSRKKVKGSMKEALGKVTGIDLLETEGAKEKNDGKAQEAVGRVQDALERPNQPPKKPLPAK